MAPKRTFVVNTNNKLVQSIFALQDQNPELAQEGLPHLYELSLLSQKELDQALLRSLSPVQAEGPRAPECTRIFFGAPLLYRTRS